MCVKTMQVLHPSSKINLFLDIKNRRKDGFHNIDTIFHEINICDKIEITELENVLLIRSSDSDISGENNIVYNLISDMKLEFNIRNGYNIYIKKNIPIGGGLGGGSSDAAYVFRYITEKHNIDISEEDSIKFLSSYGSDIPFFLKGGTCLGHNKGDILEELGSNISLNFVLVNSGIQISTTESYNGISEKDFGKGNRKLSSLITALEENDLEKIAFNMYNIFQAKAFQKYPILRSISDDFLECGALGTLMSGTGSTVFGLFGSVSEARKCFFTIRNRYNFVKLTTSVPGRQVKNGNYRLKIQKG